MSTYKRLPQAKPKKEEKEFISIATQLFHYVENNWKAVLSVGSIVITVVLAAVLISIYSGKKDESANELLYKALKEQDASEQSITAFKKVFEEYPSTSAAKVARLKLSDIYYKKGDYKSAEEMLAPIARTHERTFKILALNNIAAAKLADNDPKSAAEYYLKAYSDTKNPARGIAYFNAALAYQSAGESVEAKKIFNELSESDADYISPDLKQRSKEYLIYLASINK